MAVARYGKKLPNLSGALQLSISLLLQIFLFTHTIVKHILHWVKVKVL